MRDLARLMRLSALTRSQRLVSGMRRHLFFLVVAPIAILVMTWPTVDIARDLGTFRAPTGPSDIFMKYWDAWYGEELLAGRADFFHSDLLFHPQGLSLVFHNFSLPHMLVFGSLQKIFPPVNAYLLTYLLIIAANLLSAYMFLLRHVSRPVFACAGAFIFGLSPFVRAHETHPELMIIATIPLALYCLDCVFQNCSWRWAALAGVLVGCTAFIGLYTFVCLVASLGIYLLFLTANRWRDARFWQALLLLLLIAAGISSLRLAPMIADQALLGEALEKGAGAEQGKDALRFFVNTDHPLVSWLQAPADSGLAAGSNVSYLGIVPVLFIGIWLTRNRPKRAACAWLAVLLIFLCLSLGSHLIIGGRQVGDIALPKYMLDQLLPALTKAFYDVSNFQIGILLPLATLFCYSLEWLLRNVSDRTGIVAVFLVLLAVSFEYASELTWPVTNDRQQLGWIDWLMEEDSGADTRLIHLPMGRNQSKRYGYYQSLHGFPHVEGTAARTPSQSYAYIDSNLLLSAWRNDSAIACSDENEVVYRQAADQLRADGFTHIVYHGRTPADEAAFASFSAMPSVYDDRFARIYLVEDLQLACENPPALGATAPIRSQAAMHDRALQQVASLAAIKVHSDSLVTWRMPHSQMRVDLAGEQRRAYLERLLNDATAVVIEYGTEEPTDATLGTYRDWLMQDFHSCGALEDAANPQVEALLRNSYPCELIMSRLPLLVDYDNGARLGNLLLETRGRTLHLFLLWHSFADEIHSFSLQLIDATGERVLGYDQIIKKQELAHFQIDASALPPGDYEAKLIVYNYASRKSVSGVIVRSQLAVRREVDLGSVMFD